MSRRHRLRWVGLLVGVLLGLLTGCVGAPGTGAPPSARSLPTTAAATPTTSAPPTSAPPITPTPVPQAIPCPGDTTSPAPPWATEANTLITEYPERAEEVYEAALAKNPQEACAIRGLGAVSERQADLDAVEKAKETSSPAERAGKRWTETTAEWITPLGSLLTAGAAALLLLLVLGRLFTPWAVPPSAVGPSPRTCTALWWIGLGVTVAGVVVATSAIARSGSTVLAIKPVRWYTIGGTAAALSLLAFVVTAATRLPEPPAARGRAQGREPWGYGPVLMLAVGGSALAAAVVDRLPSLLLGAAMGIVGTAGLATIQALLLRLTVIVNGSSGTPDAQQAAYLLSRLNDLGSRPPSGLKVPEQTDVTALPVEALTSLPQGKLAAALFNVIKALRPGTAWRATVTTHDARLISVTLTRNGRATGSAVRIAAADLGLVTTVEPAPKEAKASADESAVTRQLLAAAAAYVLIELSERHPRLQRGLCGTREWRSLALHAIATDRQADVPRARREELLDLAVAIDPGNALARAARLAGQPVDRSTVIGRKIGEEIRRITQIRDGVGGWWGGHGAAEGWEPLLLRLHFQQAAAAMNAYLSSGRREQYLQGVAAVLRSLLRRRGPGEVPEKHSICPLDTLQAAAEALVSQVEKATGNAARPWLRVLLPDLEQATYYLVQTLWELSCEDGLGHSASCCSSTEELVERTDEWRPINGLVSARTAYDRACWRATTRTADGTTAWAEAARDDLRTAVVAQPRLRDWAPTDPSLAPLRDESLVGRAGVVEFWQIVGDPPVVTLLDLPTFLGYRKALEKQGLTEPADIAFADPRTLRRFTGARPVQVAEWQDVARLALPSDGLAALPVGLLGVVVALGVRSRTALERRCAAPGWNDDVVAKLIEGKIALDPIPVEDRWKDYVG